MAKAKTGKAARSSWLPRSVPMRLLLGFAVVFWLVVIFIASTALYKKSQIAKATTAAASNVQAARDNELAIADKEFAAQIATLKQAGLITTELATSKVDVCYLDRTDVGFTIARWHQVCYLRYVSGFVTTASKDKLTQEFAQLKGTFGTINHQEYMQRIFPCELVAQRGRETIRYRTAGTLIDKSAEPNATYGCEIPDQFIAKNSGPTIMDDLVTTKQYSSFNAATVDNSQDQLWIIHEKSYYHEELGCGIGIFCASPRTKPVQAP